MSFGLDGMIPDGMLIRVSSIDAEKDNAFSIQAQFSNQMFMAMTPESRQKFSGISQLN